VSKQGSSNEKGGGCMGYSIEEKPSDLRLASGC
jgi:hypothetical protein